MFGVQNSSGKLPAISLQLLRNTSLHGIRVQGIRVGNTEIPNHKKLGVALQRIHGVGENRSKRILAELGMANKRTDELTGFELNSLRDEVSKYLLAEDLKRVVRGDIERLVNIQCYRGIRHVAGLPCRGQRTHTNARTLKGRASPIAGKKMPRK